MEKTADRYPLALWLNDETQPKYVDTPAQEQKLRDEGYKDQAEIPARAFPRMYYHENGLDTLRVNSQDEAAKVGPEWHKKRPKVEAVHPDPAVVEKIKNDLNAAEIKAVKDRVNDFEARMNRLESSVGKLESGGAGIATPVPQYDPDFDQDPKKKKH